MLIPKGEREQARVICTAWSYYYNILMYTLMGNITWTHEEIHGKFYIIPTGGAYRIKKNVE